MILVPLFSEQRKKGTVINLVEEKTNKYYRFKEYTDSLIDHLVSTTTRHWDKSMRILAASSLQRLTTLQPYHFINLILPDLVWRKNKI